MNECDFDQITARVSEGEHEGEILVPKKSKTLTYTVGLTRYAKSKVIIERNQIIEYLKKGYGLRMEIEGGRSGVPATFIQPESMKIWKNGELYYIYNGELVKAGGKER